MFTPEASEEPGAVSNERIAELMREHIEVLPYDPSWPGLFAVEEQRLRSLLSPDLLIRIDHIGSTAVPGCHAKPVIDIQVEVKDLERARREVVPLLQAHGYEFIWRPSIGEMAPFYAWFIKRDAAGRRTHHVHMVEPDTASEGRIIFRDRLRASPVLIRRYEALKQDLLDRFADDRAAYTQGKTAFIQEVIHGRMPGARNE